jgi:hypothetical protein
MLLAISFDLIPFLCNGKWLNQFLNSNSFPYPTGSTRPTHATHYSPTRNGPRPTHQRHPSLPWPIRQLFSPLNHGRTLPCFTSLLPPAWFLLSPQCPSSTDHQRPPAIAALLRSMHVMYCALRVGFLNDMMIGCMVVPFCMLSLL